MIRGNDWRGAQSSVYRTEDGQAEKAVKVEYGHHHLPPLREEAEPSCRLAVRPSKLSCGRDDLV